MQVDCTWIVLFVFRIKFSTLRTVLISISINNRLAQKLTMLLVIHNLPSNIRYIDIKSLIQAKCGLTEIILDNLVQEGAYKKVTVGLAQEEDAALLMRHLNGVLLDDKQLYVEDLRQKKAQEQSQQAIHVGGSNYSNQQNPWQQQGFQYGMGAMGFNPYMQEQMMQMQMMGGMGGMYYMQQNPYMDNNQAQQSYASRGSQGDREDSDMRQSDDYYEGQGGNYDSYNRSRDWRDNEPRDRRSRWSEQQTGQGPTKQSRWSDNNEEPNQQRYRSRSPQYRETRGAGNQYQDYPNRDNDYQQQKPSPSNYYSPDDNNYSDSQGRPGGNNSNTQRGYSGGNNYNAQRGYSGGNNNSNSQRGPAGNSFSSQRGHPGGSNNSNSQRGQPGGNNSISQRGYPGSNNNSNSQRGQPSGNYSSSQRDRPGANNYDSNRSNQDFDSRKRKLEPTSREEQDRSAQNKRSSYQPPADNRPNEKPWQQSKPSFDKNPRSQQSSSQIRAPAPAANTPRSLNRRDNNEPRAPPRRPEIKPERRRPPKVSSLDVILRKNETWRQQAAAKISKEIKSKYGLVEDQKNIMADKALKKAIHTRIDLVLKGDMGVPMEDIILRYRKAFPSSGDLVFFNAVMENLKKDMLLEKEEEEKKAKAEPNASAAKSTPAATSTPAAPSTTTATSTPAASSTTTATKTDSADATSEDCVIIEDSPAPKVEPSAKVESEPAVKDDDVVIVETSAPNKPGPAPAPKQTPATAPKQPPATAPKQTPATAPKQTPATAPKQTPATAPKQTPATATDKNVYNIPKKPQINNSQQQPSILPKYPHGSKDIYKEQKKLQKMEYKNDDIYQLDPLKDKALDEQMDKFCSMFLQEISCPADEHEKFVCEKLRTNSVIYFRKALRLNIVKRLLNVRSNLVVRIFVSGRTPKANDLKKFLKKLGISSVKKSIGKKILYVATMPNYDSYDKLIMLGSAAMNAHTTVSFKPFQLAGPKKTLRKDEMNKHRQKLTMGSDGFAGDEHFEGDDINDVTNEDEGNDEGNFEDVDDNQGDGDEQELGYFEDNVGDQPQEASQSDIRDEDFDVKDEDFEVKDEDFEEY